MTNIYISHSDRTHQRILSENVASIEAASDLRAACWRLIATRIEDAKTLVDFEMRAQPNHMELADTVSKLHSTAATEHELQILLEIDALLATLDQVVQDRRLGFSINGVNLVSEREAPSIATIAERIIEKASEMGRLNRELIEKEEAEQKRLLTQMMFARSMSIVLGPLVGIVLGWRMTSRLQGHVSTLAITLRNAATNNVFQLGEISLRSGDDLKEVQVLSEQVIAQLQQIGKELERAEKEVIQSERLAAVGELAAGIAHELRNPLTSVKLLLQHAAADHDCGLVEVSNMELILNEIARMEETIQGILDFSKPANLSCKIHDIRIPLQRAVTLVSGRALSGRVDIVFQPDDCPLLVDGDAEQIHLVFVNLLINAVESIESGGTIVVAAGFSPNNQSVLVVVRDSGKGIPADLMKRLFEPFVTTKERGTGLGLALCHRIVTNHQGTILAENQSSGGAVFKVQLPAATVIKSQNLIA